MIEELGMVRSMPGYLFEIGTYWLSMCLADSKLAVAITTAKRIEIILALMILNLYFNGSDC